MRSFGVLLLAAATSFAAVQTGPDIGARIPEFEAVDQNGQARNFQNIAGPNGALLVFHRSADW